MQYYSYICVDRGVKMNIPKTLILTIYLYENLRNILF